MSDPVSTFDQFCEYFNISRSTGWNWRSKGIIETSTISGKTYVLTDRKELLERHRTNEKRPAAVKAGQASKRKRAARREREKAELAANDL